MKKTIRIEVDLDTGKVKVEADGYPGQSCSPDIDAVLKDAVKITKRTPKTQSVQQTQQQRGG